MRERKLSVTRMHAYVNSLGEFDGKRGFLHAIASHDADEDEWQCPVPDFQGAVASKSTVLRWIHACNAVYGKHEKGFVDRRNDADIVADRQRYTQQMGELMKRMELWTTDDGQVVLVDQLRSKNQDIENCESIAYDALKTQYTAAGIAIP